LTFEQNENKIRTINGQEEKMTDLLQDVVSMLTMSAFLMTMAIWIGAM
jgi:predicted site-specific integrase-resolvase